MTINTEPWATKPRAIGVDEEVMEEVLLPKVVEKDIRLVEEPLQVTGAWDELPEGGILQLKFLDQVSGPVQTGNVLRGINGECLKLALVDSGEQIVNCGPAEAEIVLLDDGNGLITHENFRRSIIKTGEKKKPHFAKRVFVILKEGVGDLTGVQLGQDSGWTKNCYCRLGATLVQSPVGIAARDAWTPPFKVGDKRNTRNEKHESPLLSSEVWRLRKIGRNGEPSKRLDKRNIETVQDFLFWFYVKPKELKQILGFGDVLWKTVVTHAKDCIIDDRRMYSHRCWNEPERSVVYDAVGRLKGLIKESHFVAVDNLSADEKENARELLVSVLEGPAFGERYDSPFDTEASFSHRSSIGNCLASSENVDHPLIILDPANVPSLDHEDEGNVEPFDYSSLMAGESSSRRSNASFCSLDPMEYFCGDDDDQYWGTSDWLSPDPASPNSFDYYAAYDTTADEPPPPQPQIVSTSGNESHADAFAQPRPWSWPQLGDVSTSGNESCADGFVQPQPQPRPRPQPQPQPRDVSTSGNESCTDGFAQPQPRDVSTSGNESSGGASTNRWKSSVSKLFVSLREKMSLDFIRSHKKRKIG